MKGKSVFCVHIDIVDESGVISNTPKLFQDEKDAVKFFMQEAMKERKIANDKGWVIEDDDEDTFCAYEDGYYNNNHVNITIREIKIN
jgi:hypothetical protein